MYFLSLGVLSSCSNNDDVFEVILEEPVVGKDIFLKHQVI